MNAAAVGKCYYAVARTPIEGGVGVYEKWSDAKPLCIDTSSGRPFTNAKFKKFSNRSEATEFVKENSSRPFFAVWHSGRGAVYSSWSDAEVALRDVFNVPGQWIDFVQRPSLEAADHWVEQRSTQEQSPLQNVSPKQAIPTTAIDRERVDSKKRKASDDDDQSSSPVLKKSRVSQEIHVYTDGACTNNGRASARAGYGVWFGHNDPRNESEPVPGPVTASNQTNQRGELIAIRRALELCRDNRECKLVIYSDSKYSMQCVTEWLANWKSNGWKTAKGTPVKNVDHIVPIDKLIAERGPNFKFQWVRGHRGVEGNEMADELARAGAKKHKK